MDQRLAREEAFHDARFGAATDPRAHLDRWYAAVAHGAAAHHDAVLAAGGGKDVLELGCGDGTLALAEWDLPRATRSYTGVELSGVAAEEARGRAAASPNVTIRQGDAADTGLPGGAYDVVFCRGVIHHLDLDRAYPEIARLLRPGGVGLFYEPLGHNPVLNAYRRATPALRSDDEQPLRRADVERARRWFGEVGTEFYGLATLAIPALRLGDGALAGAARGLDRALLALPGLRWAAWYALIRLGAPRAA